MRDVESLQIEWYISRRTMGRGKYVQIMECILKAYGEPR
jgi:hypothetical protein